MAHHTDAAHMKKTGEFELIARLTSVLEEARRKHGSRVPAPIIDIGDDAAVVRRGGAVDIYTTDTMVDGIHFRSGQIGWFDLGWKSIVSNQSDIAAMGGEPLYALVTLGVPGGLAPEHLEETYRGMGAALARFGGRVAGGDIVGSPVMFITVALTGGATTGPDGEPLLLRRDAAVPGDLVAVTGALGLSGGGLQALERGILGAEAEALKRAHCAPEPRVAEGQALAKNGVRAAMDVSDGLLADLEKLTAASGVGAVVEAESVPIKPALFKVFPDEALALALGGGEDYELLFTAPRQVMDRVMPLLGQDAAVIGRVVELKTDGPRVSTVDGAGRPVEVRHRGWDHLRA